MKDIYKSKKRLIKELEDTRRLLSQKATKELKTDVARKEARPYREVVENRRDKEALLLIRKAIDSATDAIGLSDSEGHHIYQNKAFTDLFEYTAEELGAAGGGPAAFAVKSTAREVFGSIMSGRSWSGEVEMRAKSGRIFSLFLRADAIKDDAGKIVGLVGVFTDITERKRLEYQLRKKHDELQLILDSIPAYVFYKDKDGKMLNINKAATALVYVPKEKLLQKTVFDLIPETADKYNRDDMEVIRSGQPKINIEESLELPGGVRWLKTDKIPIKDDDGSIVGLLGFSVDITDRKKAEEALRESEMRFRHILENSQDASYRRNLKAGRYDYLSPVITKLTGYSVDEMSTMSERVVTEHIHPDDREQVARIFGDALSGLSRTYRVEYRFMCRDGQYRWMNDLGSIMLDERGKQQFLVGSLRDITERKQVEAEIIVLSNAFRAALDPVLIFDMQGNVVNANEAAHKLFERNDVGVNALESVAPEDKERIAVALQGLITSGRPSIVQFSIVTRSGRRVPLEASGNIMLDASGKPVGIVVVERDLTERKRAVEALRESEERYRLLAENATDVIWIVNMGMQLTYVSPSITRLLGYTVEEALARPMSEAYTPSSFAATMQAATEEIAIEQIGQGDPKRSRILELELYRKDGSVVPVEANFSFLRDAAGKPIGILAMVRDITERKRAEEDVKRHAKRIEALYGIAQVISQSSTLDTMLKDALEKVCTAMDTESGCIFMLDFDESALKLKSYRGISESIVSQFLTIVMTEQGIEGLMKLTGPITEIDETQDVMEPEKMKKVTADIGRRGIAAVPFFRGKDLQGLIVTFTTEDRTFSSEDLELLKAIANEISIGINNMLLLEKTREMSVTDELTGLYNRRHFFETLDVEMNRARRTNHPFSLVMLDLDGFKEYNDKYGHSNGDAVLQTVSQMLKSSIRKSDLAFRYGGDEFALILPAAAAERAKKIVQRARAKWQKAPLTQSKIFGGHVGFSTGIAEYPENAESADGLIFLADAALYQAKKKGYEDKLVSELRTLSTDIMDVATQDQVYALAATVDARDPYTYGHSQRVADIAMAIGKAIGMSAEDLTKLHAAALLHDIGKVGVPDSILAKIEKPTPEEWDVIKKHCAEGARIVSYVKELSTLVPIILHHHEWYDGSGYPGGLKGIDIPSGARITSVADAYDTMVTKRPYRDVISPKKACEELKRNAGVQFDPVIVDAWCRLMDKAGKEDK